jgi:hypothetical protein
MHIHGNQLIQGDDLCALSAAVKTEAQKEAERVRKKLLEAASGPAGERGEADCVVKLSNDGEAKQHADQQGPDSEGRERQTEQAGSGASEDTFSAWA